MDQSLALEFLSKSDRHQFSPDDKNNNKIISNGKYFDLLLNIQVSGENFSCGYMY